MRLIQPCCASRDFMLLRDTIGKNGKTQFHAYGDLSLTELLPAILTRYSETTMMIVAPSIPDQASDIIERWLQKKWARMDGKGTLNCLAKLTIVADLSENVSPRAYKWLQSNPFDGRLVLINKPQTGTALLLPDIAITGPLNFQYNKEFICNVTTIPEEVAALWKQYTPKPAPKRNKRTAKKTEPSPTDEPKDEDNEKEN